jgi:hypothetical protein
LYKEPLHLIGRNCHPNSRKYPAGILIVVPHNEMKIEDKKHYIMTFFWIIAGYLCWLAGLYAFTYGMKLVYTTTKLVRSISPNLVYLSNFILLHLGDFALIFFFAFALALISGKKMMWFIGFMLCPIGIPLFFTISAMIYYVGFYSALPSWVIYYLINSIIAYLFITPLVGWLGVNLGNKLYLKRINAQQDQYSRSLRSG